MSVLPATPQQFQRGQILNPTPESNVIAVPPVICDDTDSGSDVDGSSKFDLTSFNDEILSAASLSYKHYTELRI